MKRYPGLWLLLAALALVATVARFREPRASQELEQYLNATASSEATYDGLVREWEEMVVLARGLAKTDKFEKDRHLEILSRYPALMEKYQIESQGIPVPTAAEEHALLAYERDTVALHAMEESLRLLELGAQVVALRYQLERPDPNDDKRELESQIEPLRREFHEQEKAFWKLVKRRKALTVAVKDERRKLLRTYGLDTEVAGQ